MFAERSRAIGIAVVTLFLAMLAHWDVHLGYLRRINFANPPSAPGETGRKPAVLPRAARRLRVLLVDGLGFDQAMGLAPFQALAREGVARPLLAEFPSFTFASLTSIGTGRPPLWSGVRVNGPHPLRPWDSVSREAVSAGKSVALSDAGLEELGSLLVVPEEARRVGVGEAFHRPYDLAWIYFRGVDDAAHRYGVDSDPWREAARQAGALAAAARANLDPTRDALFVLSDHGHLKRGGHGGEEPEALRATFIALGPGMLKGAQLPPLAMRDVASTIAATLGVPPPKDSLGRASLDLWGLEPPRDDKEASDDAGLEAKLFLETGGIPRLTLALVAWLVLVAGALLGRFVPRPGPRDVLPTLLFAALFFAGYFAAGYRVSWSIGRSQLVFEVETAVLALAALTVAGLFSRPERRLQEAVVMLLLTGGASLVTAAWIGWDLSLLAWPTLSFGFLLAVTLFFYGGWAWAITLLRDQRAFAPGQWAAFAAASALLFAAPLVLRYCLPA